MIPCDCECHDKEEMTTPYRWAFNRADDKDLPRFLCTDCVLTELSMNPGVLYLIVRDR